MAEIHKWVEVGTGATILMQPLPGGRFSVQLRADADFRNAMGYDSTPECFESIRTEAMFRVSRFMDKVGDCYPAARWGHRTTESSPRCGLGPLATMSPRPSKSTDQKEEVQTMKREDVERVARIVGDHTTAAKALEDAKAMTDPVFVRMPIGITAFETAEREE